ncbi:MAG: type II toxin-antitoxin system Phd/YefM family antitoxin [Burkholderiales bacterium]|nr:type II toxin-antitoxin system Phd/YefM family antitoxin [Burkholderiales bacterium]
MKWQLADAKNRLSEVINKALSEGPQKITRRNDTVIILSQGDYEKLIEQQPGFKDFLLNQTPDLKGLDLKRDKGIMRDIDL